MATVASRVEAYVKHFNRGSVFTFNTVVSTLGDAQKDTVNHALKRLEKRNEIVHVKKGVYLRPKMSRFGPIPVEPGQVVRATAQSIGAKAFPSGAYALNALGLSPQMVMGQSYVVTRRIAPFKVNNAIVKIRYSRSLERVEPLFKGLVSKERKRAIMIWLSLEYLGETETKQRINQISAIINTLSPKARGRLRSAFSGKLRWAGKLFSL